LKSADQQAGSSLCATRLTTEPLLPNYAVFVEKYGQTQLRCVLGEAVNIDLRVSRFGKPPTICRRSSLRRGTMMSSSIRLLAFTPRQNRCGSRISCRAEKLLE